MPSQVHADPARDIDSDSDATTARVDLLEVMREMTVPERRRVYALQGLLKDYHALRAQMRAEVAALTKESVAECRAIFDARRDIVSGARDITPEELTRIGAVPAPSSSSTAEAAKGEEKPAAKKGVKVVDPVDEKQNSELEKAAASPSGGIPNFWLTAMSNSEALNSLITEKDRDALSHLVNIEKTFIDEDPEKGDRLVFHFSPNEYFTNATLTKEYHTEYDEDHGEMRIADVVGCTVDWKSPKKNLTVIVKQKKQRNKKSGQMRIVEREEPCESFFNFFSPPTQKAEDEDEEEEDDFFEQEMEMDVEAGTALLEAVVPRAIFYYTGEAVVETGKELREQFGFGEGEEDEEGDEEDEEDEDEDDDEAGGSNFRNIVRQRGGGGAAAAGGRGRGRGGAGAGTGAGAQPPQQECKQQ
ncbi:nucleosome assembly protein-like protein [Leptomonas pyrrhocoris]|uniref:Nucleosome assembly protein-like protein n=1 Tax=Leptomonas pyrrhocoris TaxID=157538 RepID=A0A0N0VET3_LEPPY|nr:nucleosome assembly protein-like protein [Leptomonas pyrrhocoris]XP_015657271.1 nucleosome assembly protein-like protein [Leptomonas pyrrhocoris]XP_015657272.1 nucleosome assembly protein-like protein [Leptomonas pyrrhocoris]XP_015657273.1 nucleosome assembly protein-like protein [Leptomonas pyrrhocoris]XP_015657274.1 nucleosome assembly protein-like protein [Leptomonas pyrrhocoris]XP_015657275.1 nucleosome assembly protein-like protein [Leptomonas pyrrhocoris]KPA78831.1 nucleosome assembl|eukprot:XP_015657270.1 nucleosome assembly protein-like protein [Leptomonas pyrrhocoris]